MALFRKLALAAMPNIKLYPGTLANVMIPSIQRTAFDYIDTEINQGKLGKIPSKEIVVAESWRLPFQARPALDRRRPG
jgi:hypothetical protein